VTTKELSSAWAVYLGSRKGVFSLNSRARPGMKFRVEHGVPFRVEPRDRWVFSLRDYVGLTTFSFAPETKRIPRAKPDYLTKYAAAWMEGLAAGCPDPARVVEVGTASGTSLLRILYGLHLHEDAFVWSVDIEECPQAQEHIVEAQIPAWRYTLVNLPSLVAADMHTEPLDMVYLDGNHSYDGVKADIWAWKRHLKPSGIMVFDDYDNEMHEVTPAVNELMFANGDEWDFIGQIEHMVVFEKREEEVNVENDTEN
jgi:hypothetical protein